MSIGRVPLGDAIARLLAELRPLREGARIEFCGDDLAASYGEAVDLTVYGSIREGVTNALRHADCSKVEILLHMGAVCSPDCSPHTRGCRAYSVAGCARLTDRAWSWTP